MDGHKPIEPISGSVWRLAGMGTELAAAVLGGCALGWWVDRAWGTGHWGLVVGALIGIVGGLYNLIRKAVHESLGLTGDKGSDASDSDDGQDKHPGQGEYPSGRGSEE